MIEQQKDSPQVPVVKPTRKRKSEVPIVDAQPFLFLPQLPITLSEAAGERFIDKVNGTWCAQEVFDGKRVLIHKRHHSVTATNKQGKPCVIPACVTAMVGKLHGDCTLDGTLCGDVYHAADMLWNEGHDYRHQPYGRRLLSLRAHVGNRLGNLCVVHTVHGMRDVRKLFEELKDRKAEGMSYRDKCMPHVAGDAHRIYLRFEFQPVCACIVLEHVANRSVELVLYKDDGTGAGWRMGTVTIPSDEPLPILGAVVEVAYKHAAGPSGPLIEPQYIDLSERANKDCIIGRSNLRYRSEPLE